MLPPLIEIHREVYKEDRLKYFIKYVLPDYDIVCNQECFFGCNSRKQNLVKYSELNGFPYHATSQSPQPESHFVVDGGLITLSRFPILDSEFVPFKYGIFSDSTASKGVLYTKILVKDQYLLLFNTHLQASYISVDIHEIEAALGTREQQIVHIRDFINVKVDQFNQAHPNKQPLVMLVGDLNVNSRVN